MVIYRQVNCFRSPSHIMAGTAEAIHLSVNDHEYLSVKMVKLADLHRNEVNVRPDYIFF